ncbi:MAG TPA: AP2 domain-containing protein [Gammaproteobacteria bacterium]|nr:AP2 domain-containing protein [Gammaproteobacteria bacterium]
MAIKKSVKKSTKKKGAKKAVTKKATRKKALKQAVKKGAARKATTKEKGLGLTYITRMDHGNTHGWWVRVYKDSRPVESKLFSDGVYGGKNKAKLAAQEHRDKVVKKNKIVPVHMRKTREHSVDCRSTSGLVGVTLSVADKGGSLRVHWSARFMEKGKQRNVSFSVRKYGYEGAFRKAVRARSEAIGTTVPRGLTPPAPSRELKKWIKSVGA